MGWAAAGRATKQLLAVWLRAAWVVLAAVGSPRAASGSPLSLSALANSSLTGSAAVWCHDGTDPAPCVPALRLTAGTVGLSGAAWWRTAVNASSAWEARLVVRMTRGGSSECPELDGQQVSCVQRGGHGLAFVVQDGPGDPLLVAGGGARGLGYEGIVGAVAAELDTWYDDALGDLFNNHVAVQAGGATAALSSDHVQHLAMSAQLGDLGDGAQHAVRIVYDPQLDPAVIHPQQCAGLGACDKLQSSEQLGRLLSAGMAAQGIGSLSVYVDDLSAPVLVAALSLQALVPLRSGRPGVTVGVTAATGTAQWQAHDIESWEMCVSGSPCQSVFVP